MDASNPIDYQEIDASKGDQTILSSALMKRVKFNFEKNQ